MIVKEFAKLRALRALVPCVPRALHALVPHVPYVLSCLTCLVPYVLLCLTCLVPYVLSCPTCLVPYVLSCRTCSRALRTLAYYVLSCIVPYVFLCLTCLTCSCTSSALRFACSRAARDSGSTGPCAPGFRTVLLHHRFYSILLKYFTSERDIPWVPYQIHGGALCDKLVWSNQKLLSQKLHYRCSKLGTLGRLFCQNIYFAFDKSNMLQELMFSE